MEKFQGLLGISFILGLAYAFSTKRKSISYRVVISGLILQFILGFIILKTAPGVWVFDSLGRIIEQVLKVADKGGEFVFGGLMKPELLKPLLGSQYSFLFMFKIIPTIIFVSVLVQIAYHTGLMQRIVSMMAFVVYRLMRVSGSEALSNMASVFVGQVEAQILIKPYIGTMTKSELLASMSGSMACIAGGVMAIYISMGIPASYLLAASLMAIPGSLVISKIILPETEESVTKSTVKLEIKKTHANMLDAISSGAATGLKVALNIIAMLIAFIALIELVNIILHHFGALLMLTGLDLSVIGIDLSALSLNAIFGSLFSAVAWVMGVPAIDTHIAGSLMGTKLVMNEFVAYSEFTQMMATHSIHPKSILIITFALCGFANFGSIAIQVGGIGELAPERRADLARLGFKALLCGTLASYLSATIAGLMM